VLCGQACESFDYLSLLCHSSTYVTWTKAYTECNWRRVYWEYCSFQLDWEL